MADLTTPGQPPTAPPDEPTHWLVKPETIRMLWIVFGVILAGIAAADFFVEHYEYFGIDSTFAFYAWFGFTTCVAMVVGAKVLGIFLKRPDDYYKPQGEPGEPGSWTEETGEAAAHAAQEASGEPSEHAGDSHHGSPS